MRPFEAAVVAAGVVYLAVLGWAMQSLSYDIWGAFVVVPVLSLISAPLIMRASPATSPCCCRGPGPACS